jgi:riboflavin biosynthesis pyrimidine reductase
MKILVVTSKTLSTVTVSRSNFEILFDDGEPSRISDPAYAPYGKLGFPAPYPDRPWIYSNFVQSLDGITSFKGRHPLGSDISQSAEDRWLMDLLRAHADAIILGVNTLVEETRVSGERGPVYRIEDDAIRGLREKLGRRRETNIFVTGAARLDLDCYRVFDGDLVDALIVSTTTGAARLLEKKPHPRVRVIVAGEGDLVDLPKAMRILRAEFGIEYLLCEGGPTLYGYMSRAGMIDEKFITISPLEVGLLIPPEQEPSEAEKLKPPVERPTTFVAPGFTQEKAPWWRWMSCRRVGNHQFNRYRRSS